MYYDQFRGEIREVPHWLALPLPLNVFPENTEGPIVEKLFVGREIEINEEAKTIRLRRVGGLEAHNSKVSLRTVYSELMNWLDEPRNMDIACMMSAQTPQMFTFLDSWGFADDASRHMIHGAAWEENNDIWFGINIIGSIPTNEPLAIRMGENQILLNQTGTGHNVVKWDGQSNICVYCPLRGNLERASYTVSIDFNYPAVLCAALTIY